MLPRHELVAFLDELLEPPEPVKDSSNNGLQVEGGDAIERAIFSVDACVQLFDAAVEREADFVFVHHGLSWGDSLKYLTGPTARRVGALFQNGISLYASHLPLDMHPELGHNAVIARRLGLVEREPFFRYGGIEIGFSGRLREPVPLGAFVTSVDRALATESQVVNAGPETVVSVAVVSGGAADAIADCVGRGVDCLVTGEMLHQHYHTALEAGVNVVAAGHYRSEVPGVRAVMARVQEEFTIECEFIDLPTGY